MKRKIVRLWAEYESDNTPYPVIEPISIRKAQEVIEEGLKAKEEKEESIEKTIFKK